MSDAVSITVITGVNGLLTLVVGSWLKERQDRHRMQSQEEHQETQKAIEVVRNDVNDKMQQFIQQTREVGITQGRAEAKQEAKEK